MLFYPVSTGILWNPNPLLSLIPQGMLAQQAFNSPKKYPQVFNYVKIFKF